MMGQQLVLLVLMHLGSSMSFLGSKSPIKHQDEIRAITKELIEDLGLSHVPHVAELNVSLNEYARLLKVYRKSVKQTELLQDLQEEFAEEEEAAMEIESQNTDPNAPQLTKSMFLTSRHRYSTENLWSRRKRNINRPTSHQGTSSGSMTLHYPLEASPEAGGASLVLVESATLHITLRLKSSMKETRKINEEELKIAVRQILDGNDDHSGVVIDNKRFKVKDAFTTNNNQASSQGMDVALGLDVSHAVQQWILRPEENFGLRIECSTCAALGVELIMPQSDSPSLVVDTKQRTMSFSDRQKRSYLDMDSVILKKSRRRRVDCKSNSNDNSDKRQRKQRCCRQKMRIDFSKLDGFQHILQPATFDAHVCQGRCPSRFNPANDHALLQSLMHRETRHLGKRDGKVPRPCCAPSKLLPLPILHLSEDSQHKLDVSHWKNVIVGECRCS